jgi:murein hydrolase activator
MPLHNLTTTVTLLATAAAASLTLVPHPARAVAAPPPIAKTGPMPERSATNFVGKAQQLGAEEKKQLNARYARVLATQLGLLQALDGLDKNVEETERRIAAIAARRAEATDRLRDAERQRAQAEKRIAHMRRAVKARLRAIVRLRRTAGLRFALSSREHADAVITDRVLRRLLKGDRERLRVYRERLTEVATITDRRNAALSNLDHLDAELHEQKAGQERQRYDKQALIIQINADPVYNERIRRDLDAANRALAERIATFKQWQERRYTFGLTRGRLLRPVNFSLIERPFGPLRNAKFGTTTYHRGVDIRPKYAAKVNYVRAVFWGRVAFVGRLLGYGNTIILDHGKGWHSVYSHIVNVRVKVGEVVRSRARVADVGGSGSLKGPYLYFEIRENGQPRNPALWFR